ncbi:MAG: RNA 2',3'-cyclic phosphodiesterase [Fidelibacterota bacterium]
MKRTFFAVKASNQTQKILENISEEFSEFDKKVKPANPGNPHITLKFLGDTREEDIDSIDQEIRFAISRIPAFSFVCEGTGCFPRPSRPSVLWLGITEGLNYLKTLHNLLELKLEKFGYTPDNSEFIPHLTYGRVRKQYKKLNSINRFLNYDYGQAFNPVETVIWFESILTSKGAQHKPLRQYQLNKISGGKNVKR